MHRRQLLLGLAALALLACGKKNDQPAGGASAGADPGKKPPGPITVAAAADLTKAFEEIGREFEAGGGGKVTFKFGSTGQIAQQLRQGAPFDVFAAANVSFIDDVVAAGACDGATKTLYARGRIVLWSRKGGVAPARSLDELTDGRFVKIAIANPDHAPYGKAAREALEKAGVWDKVKDRLVFGENIKQTMQFAETGNAEVAIVALSLATGSDGEYTTIDEALHNPLEQAMAACKGEGDAATARAFVAFVGSEKGRAIMRKYGFMIPGEKPAE
jgi:molybdate transport system substrate-binding protein